MKKELKRKILPTFLALAVVLLAIPLVSAVPWTPRNNEKFQTYSVTMKYNFLDVLLNSPHEWIPSTDKPNKLIIIDEEDFDTMEITVGTNTYSLGIDFAYTGLAIYTFHDPVFEGQFGLLMPSDWRSEQLVVDYMYDFSAYPDGLEGTLQMRSIANGGGFFINSIAGTGDLKNVQVKATQGSIDMNLFPMITIPHVGLVSGWPE